jgi:hypothetical protein
MTRHLQKMPVRPAVRAIAAIAMLSLTPALAAPALAQGAAALQPLATRAP